MPKLPPHCEFDFILGCGLVTKEPTMLHGIIFTPISNSEFTTIYHGRDTVSGDKICKIITAYVITRIHYFGHPIYCPKGIYVAGSDDLVETTIVHRVVS